MAFTPDARIVAFTVVDPTSSQPRDLASPYTYDLYIWDLVAGRSRRLAHAPGLGCPAFSADGNLLACGFTDSVRVWAVRSRASLHTLPYHAGILSFSHDGRRLAASGIDSVPNGSIRVSDLSAGAAPILLTGHEAPVIALAFSRDGRRLASTSYDQTVRLWDLSSQAEIASFMTPSISSVAFDPEGRRLFTGGNTASSGGEVRVWDPSAPARVSLIEGNDNVNAVAFAPHGESLASGSDDGTLRIWNVSRRLARLVVRAHDYAITSLAFDSGGRRVITASADKSIKVWDSESGGPPLLTLAGHTDQVTSVDVSPSGRQISSTSKDKTARVWSATTGDEIAASTCLSLPIPQSSAGMAAFSLSESGTPARLSRASGGRKTLHLWNWQASRLVAMVDASEGSAVVSVALSPDGSRVAIAGSNRADVFVWNSHLQQRLRMLKGDPASPVKSVAFAHDGKRIVTLSDRRASIFDMESNEPLLVLSSGFGAGPVFSLRTTPA